jgi:predicted neuraminidase
MRDSGDAPARVQKSISNDNGETWSAAIKTEIPNTASVELCVLKDGKWAFLGNDVDDGRYKLSLYLSDDEGESWKWKFSIEDEEKGKGGFSYPSLIQTPDGTLHMTYSYHMGKGNNSIKYVALDPKKIFE